MKKVCQLREFSSIGGPTANDHNVIVSVVHLSSLHINILRRGKHGRDDFSDSNFSRSPGETCWEQRKLPIPNVLERIRFLLAESLSPQDGGRTQEVVAFQEAIEEMKGGSSPLVVDVQCLWLDKDYVIKEFAVTTDGMAIACITIKQLSEENPRSRRNQFVVDTIHGIRWEDGLIDESELRNYTTALFAPGREVVVKSCDKVNILVYRLGINRSDVRVIAKDCPRFEVLRNFHFSDGCVHHQGLSHRLGCASRHVHAMKCFLQGDKARHNRRKRV
ncbi:hypothetical protein J6590_095944 [Homalodisca vitripennis]|nr:hypothetical protein J6590_095944 [Homalodisca vitripennis]